MRKLLYVIVITILGFPSFGQNEIHHQIPGNPAFSILDFEPVSVLRPSSPSELTTNILNSFDEEGRLKPNLGLEVAPYWLKSRPSLTRKEYLNPTLFQSIKQTFQLSAASVFDSLTDTRRQSVGFRFQLVPGKPTEKYLALSEELKGQLNLSSLITPVRAFIGDEVTSRQQAIELILNNLKDSEDDYSDEFIHNFKLKAEELATEYSDSREGIRQFVEKLNTAHQNDSLALKTAHASREKVGFFLELAGASAFNSADESGDNPSVARTGFWLTASEKYTEQDQWMLTARYMFSSKDSLTTNFDLGLSYIKDLEHFSLSIEAVARWYEVEFDDLNANNEPIRRVEDDFTYRLAANLTYHINEFIYLNASMGKNYGTPLVADADFFSIIGLNFNLFRKTTEVKF